MEITLEALALAYRKAKVDLYYSSQSRELDLLAYEQNLAANLTALQTALRAGDEDFFASEEFIGGYTFVPKTVSTSPRDSGAGHMRAYADPWEEWRQRTAGSDVPNATVRLMATCGIGFHVLSSLWLMTVGSALDQALPPQAYGHRLRRKRSGEFNELALGSFAPYLKPYQRWRDDAYAAAQQALDDGREVVVVTGDARAYFHSVDPKFLVDPDFARYLAPEHPAAQEALAEGDGRTLTRIFVGALEKWSSRTRSAILKEAGDPKKLASHMGLPVGLPASAVVANLALLAFDDAVLSGVKPLHYGRYVDDLMIVLDATGGFGLGTPVAEWIAKRAGDAIRCTNEGDLIFTKEFLSGSNIEFTNDKNRDYFLKGAHGAAALRSLRHAIAEQSSEWRMLQALPDDAQDVATQIVGAMQSDGERANSLRKTESVVARRAGFSLHLREMESAARDLDLGAWKEHRDAFFEAICHFVLEPRTFFDLWTFFPRLVRLALATQELDWLKRVVKQTVRVIKEFDNARWNIAGIGPLGAGVKSRRLVGALLRHYVASVCLDAVAVAYRSAGHDAVRDLAVALLPLSDRSTADMRQFVHALQTGPEMLERDLAAQPWRRRFEPGATASDPCRLASDWMAGIEPPLAEIREGIDALATVLDMPADFLRSAPALLFPTRPFNSVELSLLSAIRSTSTTAGIEEVFANKAHANGDAVSHAMLGLRGYRADEPLPPGGGVLASGARTRNLSVQSRIPPRFGVGIALGVLKTSDAQFQRALQRQPDQGVARYRRVAAVVNEAIRRSRDVHYLVLPELSLPRAWFIPLALKLAKSGISLLAGIEYGVSGRTVTNQMWASLIATNYGFPSPHAVVHEKQRPAPAEEINLLKLGQLAFPERSKLLPPLVVEHGDFTFSMLICSELTNIDYRAALRGQVDALFVVEWNHDHSTFNALVESAALDIHAYVVQSNNRMYGENRIRVPAAKSHERDIVRHLGGVHDYAVVARIDPRPLRLHHSVHRPLSEDYKPLPDGFRPSARRLRLPEAEK